MRHRVRQLTLVHGGIVAESEEITRLLIAELRSSLCSGDADVIWLPSLPTDEALYRLAATQGPRLFREASAPPATHHRLDLPASFEAFLASRSKATKKKVKLIRNRIERDYRGRLQVHVHSKPEDIDTIFRLCEPIAAKTYQRGLGVALADTPQQRRLIAVGLRRGWFRLYSLSLDGSPISFWPGWVYNGTFFSSIPGYDPEFAKYSVGTYLLLRIIEDLCEEPAVLRIDYGLGDAEYKRQLATDSWVEQDVRLYSATPRALMISVSRSAVTIGANSGRAVLDRYGLTQ